MKKFVLLILAWPVLVFAQFDASMFSTNNQQLIEEAMAKGFFVTYQPYQLMDSVTNQRFGRYGNEEFGHTQALAIRLCDGVIFYDRVLKPWEEDENYERYQGRYEPIRIKTKSIELMDSAYIEFPIDYSHIAQISEHIVFLQDSLFADGFQVQDYDGPTEGWLVWVTNERDEKEFDTSTPFDFTIYRQTVDFSPNTPTCTIRTPQVTTSLWGGVFIVCERTAIGQLTFMVGGILSMDANREGWNLVPIRTIQHINTSLREEGDELTPLNQNLNKKEKRKK